MSSIQDARKTTGRAGVSGLWAPGVKLMGHVNFPLKALIISLVFLLPVALLGYFFVSAQNDQIAFSAKERVGVQAFQALVPVSGSLLQLDNLVRATAGGYDGAAKTRAAQDAVEKSLQAFDKYLLASGDPLALKQDVDALKTLWSQAAASASGLDAQGQTVFGAVNDQLLKLLGRVGDNSNLALDPDIDSYYLFSTINMLPQLRADLGQTWAWGTYAKARSQAGKKELDHADVIRFAVWSANAQSGLDTARGYLDKVFAANPGAQGKLDMALFAAAAGFHAAAQDVQLLQKDHQLATAAFFERGQAAVDKVQGFYDKALPTLDQMLKARIDALVQKMKWAGLAVLLGLLVAAYLFYSFTWSPAAA